MARSRRRVLHQSWPTLQSRCIAAVGKTATNRTLTLRHLRLPMERQSTRRRPSSHLLKNWLNSRFLRWEGSPRNVPPSETSKMLTKNRYLLPSSNRQPPNNQLREKSARVRWEHHHLHLWDSPRSNRIWSRKSSKKTLSSASRLSIQRAHTCSPTMNSRSKIW